MLALSSQLQQQAAKEQKSFPNLPGSGLVNFLKGLTSATTWVRVGLFVTGIILILMGLQQFAKVLGVQLPSIPGLPKL